MTEIERKTIGEVEVQVPPSWMGRFEDRFPKARWDAGRRSFMVLPEDLEAVLAWLGVKP